MPISSGRRASLVVVAVVVAAAVSRVDAVAVTVVRPADVVVTGDAVVLPLTAAPGDPVRGRAIVADRQLGLCLLCHTGPFPDERFQGTLAPDLAGVGLRRNEAQLRLRLVDSRRLDPGTIMPSYFVADEGDRTGRAWRGRTVLDAQQIEDVVAFLATLR